MVRRFAFATHCQNLGRRIESRYLKWGYGARSFRAVLPFDRAVRSIAVSAFTHPIQSAIGALGAGEPLVPARRSSMRSIRPRAQSRIARPLGVRLCGFVLRRFRVHAASLGNDLRRGRNRPPSRQPLKNALGILDRGDVTVVLLDHLYRRAHLISEEIHIDPLGESEGRIGMPEAIWRAAAARWTHA